MKQELKQFFPEGFETMTMTDCEQVNGGESAWYWLAYGVGSLAKALFTGGPTMSQKVCNMALS